MTASTPAVVDTGLVSGLRAVVKGEVSDSPARRAQYSTDASNYRIPPLVVVFPEDAEDLEAIAQVSRDRGVALTMRGGGTSVAGNSIGPGIVVDTSRRMNQILDIDAAAGIVTVQPGVVLTALQRALSPHGLRFGPDPSTQSRAVIGGMIGNNACGPRAVAYGRTADNVSSLEVVDGRGRRFRAEKGMEVIPGLQELVDSNLGLLRTELGRFGRQVSGYSLEHLLPENGRDLAKALVGTEGTIAVVLEATLKLVPISPAPALAVLGYSDMATAADAVPALLAHKPLAIEGIDARLVDVLKRHSGAGAVPELPAGRGWLLVEVGGENAAEADYRARQLVTSSGTSAVRIYPAGAAATALWRIREDGAGLAGRTSAGNQAWPGWEDAAVPPERLGAYLREFEALMANYGVEGLPYGHFGDGCIHVRIDIPLEEDGAVLRSFVTESAKLVVAHGGSLSGEHGDGRARSELLELMYTPRMIGVFGAFKHLFDPTDLLNPGIIVAPAKLDQDLRRPQAVPLLSRRGFSFAQDGGDFTKAVHRCVGVGKCRAVGADSGDFMCPSFQATRDENDVTRGRARVLQEMVNGSLITKGWQSPEVHDALDLCLSCKACSRDCPAGVDMAQYKSEVLFRRFRRRIRPMSHYVLGWLPRWAVLAGIAPRLVNAITQLPFVRKLLPLGGMDPRRRIPKFAEKPFLRDYRKAPHRPRQGRSPRVVLWVDSFSDAFSPGIPGAAIRVLQDAGYQVIIPDKSACCGLTWISTGQLDGAKRRLEKLLGVLGPFAEDGIPIVGLEPSCTAVLRSDLVDLLPDDPRARAVSTATKTLAEILTAAVSRGWEMPDLSDVRAVVQPHCHHHSVMGFETDVALMASAGASLSTLVGCCGLAGNFGMEKGHYETSVKVAESALLPALRVAPEATIFLADGFSCRTQADQLAGVSGVSLAELLAEKIAQRPLARAAG